MNAYLRSPSFHAEMDVLLEIGRPVDIEFGPPEVVEEVRRAIRTVRKDIRYRMVCAGGDAQARTFFLASMDGLNRHAETKAFETVAEALDWLGVAAAAPGSSNSPKGEAQKARNAPPPWLDTVLGPADHTRLP